MHDATDPDHRRKTSDGPDVSAPKKWIAQVGFLAALITILVFAVLDFPQMMGKFRDMLIKAPELFPEEPPWTMIKTVGAHNHTVNGLAFNAEGDRLATGSRDHTTRVWDVATMSSLKMMGPETETYAGPGSVSGVAFSRDGRMVAASYTYHGFRIWDASSFELLREFELDDAESYDIEFGPESDAVILAHHSDIEVYMPETRSGRRLTDGHSATINDIQLSEDGVFLISGGKDGRVCLWETMNWNRKHQLTDFGEVSRVAISSDSQLMLACGPRSTLTVWDTASGTVVRAFSHNGEPVTAKVALFVNDGRLVMSGNDGGELHLWDIETGRLIGEFASAILRPLSMQVSPTEELMVIGGSEGRIEFWKLGDPAELKIAGED